MIVRIVLWRLSEDQARVDELRAVVGQLDPFEQPSTWLSNDASESFGAILHTNPDEDEGLPEQIATIRELIGRDPDLYEEYDTLGTW